MAARQAKRVTVAKVIGEARRSPRRLQRRLQRDVLREVMLSASECNAWLTLEELARITRYPAASISAQLRHFAETAARRLPAAEALASVDESCHVSRGGGVRAWPLWEYRLERGQRATRFVSEPGCATDQSAVNSAKGQE